jgi:hypothetical protein
MSSRLSYHQKNQKKNRETITGILSGRSRFAKTKKSEEISTSAAAAAETSTTSTSRPTTSTVPMSRPTSRPPTPRQVSPQPPSPHVIISGGPPSPHVIISGGPPSPSQTTPASTSRKRRKTTTGVAEIGDDGKSSNFEILRNILNIQTNVFTNLDDDYPLTRKEAKVFFNELKKEISDVRKLLEISGVGDYATDETFIKVNIICEIS